MNLAEFFVSLTVDADQQALDNFNEGVSELDRGLSLLGQALAGVAVGAFVTQTVDAVTAITNFRSQTGLLAADLQRWQIAGELSDISLGAEGVTQSITALQDNLTQIRMGGGNVAPFQLLGIDVAGQDAFQVLESVRSAIRGLDDATATNLIQQLGLTPQFINVLRLTNEEFEALVGERTFLSEEKIGLVADMGTALTSLKLVLVSLKDQIVAAVAPVITFLAEEIATFSQRLATFADNNPRVVRAIAAIGAAFALLRLGLAPIILIGTVFVAILDDLIAYMNGTDSAIGRLISMVKNLGSAIAQFVTGSIEDAGEAVSGVFDSIAEAIREAHIAVFEFGDAIINAVLKPVREAADIIKTVFGQDEESRINITPDLAERVLSDVSLNGTAGRVNNLSTSFMNTYNINSSADPRTISENIVNMQQRELNYSLSDLNNGMAN